MVPLKCDSRVSSRDRSREKQDRVTGYALSISLI